MTCSIVPLRPVDRLRQDAGPIAAIYRDLDTQTAEQVVTRALGELALTMAGLSAQMRARDLSDLHRQLRRVQRMAEHLGMVSLALVARDVRQCLDSSDVTAFSAVWSRLMRVAEQSLSQDGKPLDQTV
ncbi:hypothetical protein GEU84_009765 [Fertoebacter nigrum]|uniref:Hpt domain-containing protein n=1 Tax=Fertoeibacter niger TaxID=2656921 RepID=A0A8X8H1S2_9RHOB|nr:hypothetical protein [Fertoeibacter niger]NUB44669.1 hypothetical protein [Fertoeibacter niger]